MEYAALKLVHVGSVALSYGLFFLRGVWTLRGSVQLSRRWVRVVPHIVDTVLLASAIALTVAIHQYPFVNGWLTAKVLGLLAYIVVGHIALRRARSRRRRLAAWVAAQGVFFYIVAVAITKRVLVFA